MWLKSEEKCEIFLPKWRHVVSKVDFSVTLNIRVKNEGVKKAGFFADCPMFVDFGNVSPRENRIFASEWWSLFFSGSGGCDGKFKIKWKKQQQQRPNCRTWSRPLRARLLVLRAFAMGLCAYASLARHLAAVSRRPRSSRESHRSCTWGREPAHRGRDATRAVPALFPLAAVVKLDHRAFHWTYFCDNNGKYK